MGKTDNLVDVNGCITLMSTQVNRLADLMLQAVPTSYSVYINDDLVYSFNDLENARIVYEAVRADMTGGVYGR